LLILFSWIVIQSSGFEGEIGTEGGIFALLKKRFEPQTLNPKHGFAIADYNY
jgi:hypothetical protein